MRIAIFTDTFCPQVNGVVTATLSLAKGLANRGHKIFIIAPKSEDKSEFKYKNIKVIRLSGVPALVYPGFRLTSPFNLNLFNELKRNKIDLVHFQTPATIGANAIITAKMLKVPIVGTFHTFMAHPEYRRHICFQFKFFDKFSWNYTRAYYNKCDLITSPSETTKKELIAQKFNRHIKVISNGIDLSKFKPSIGSKKDSKNLLFVGRIAYEKNIFYLLDCFDLILKKVPNAKLIIVGDGPQMNKLKRKIKQLNLSEKVVITGMIKNNVLLKSSLLKDSNIFVSTSKTENQPMTLLEAQANGLVPVVLNEMGMKDLIKDGYNGYLIKDGDKKMFADQVCNLLNNFSLVKKFRKNVLKEIKKQDIKKVINTWEKTYQSLILNKKL